MFWKIWGNQQIYLESLSILFLCLINPFALFYYKLQLFYVAKSGLKKKVSNRTTSTFRLLFPNLIILQFMTIHNWIRLCLFKIVSLFFRTRLLCNYISSTKNNFIYCNLGWHCFRKKLGKLFIKLMEPKSVWKYIPTY